MLRKAETVLRRWANVPVGQLLTMSELAQLTGYAETTIRNMAYGKGAFPSNLDIIKTAGRNYYRLRPKEIPQK